MRLGYNTWSAPHLAFDEAVRALSRIGYDSVEVTVCEGWPTDAVAATDEDAARWRHCAEDVGLQISSVTANAPLVCDDDTWVESRRRLIRSFEVAAVLGDGRPLPVSLGAHKPKAPLLGGNPPPIVAQDSWDSDQALIIDRFGELVADADGVGCTVALEPHAGAVVSTPEHALAVLDAVASSALGINLDISHFAVRDFDLAAVVAALLPRAVVVEVKDHRRAADGFDFLIPGEGEFDYPAFLRLLDDGAYDGTVSVEISVRRQALPDFDEVRAAELSYLTLSEAARAAGITLGSDGSTR
ncbi:sugar phosphate isomerase/epimerase [Microbacterium sp. NEAU-LLC]|uniref:Sugar phosphate isomerase/epimerase n=1 Tax=Microbacterium helvum TaxID=2773713 RepID=A0ABR8NHL1_9MICO|nr:sugar phosphate isomerase/epimerase family protein [Microbacterium helvum]MBD3940180.1 sugar phosphate isomerase/epimerase [Microbacterium helvum]